MSGEEFLRDKEIDQADDHQRRDHILCDDADSGQIVANLTVTAPFAIFHGSPRWQVVGGGK
jgi:hypothetical protein